MFTKLFQSAYKSKKLPFLFTSAYLTYNLHQRQKKVDCCGIIGVITTKNNAEDFIIKGIKYLENR